MKYRFFFIALLAGCSFFKSDPELATPDASNDVTNDATSDAAHDLGEDSPSSDMGRDQSIDVGDDVPSCPADTAGCAEGETSACSDFGFDRGAATCSSCEWDTTECGTCDLFWAADGDDDTGTGLKEAPFKTLARLSMETSSGGGVTTLCLKRGDTFELDSDIAVTRSGVTVTSYGDPLLSAPLLHGSPITLQTSADASFTHQAQFVPGYDYIVIWSGDEWFSTSIDEPGHEATYDTVTGLVRFSPADASAQAFAAPNSTFRVSSPSGLAVNEIVVSELAFEHIGTAVSINSPSGEGRDFFFSDLAVRYARFVASVGVAFQGWTLDDVTFSNVEATKFVDGIAVSYNDASRNIVVENSSFSEPIPFVSMLTFNSASPITVGAYSYLIVRNSFFDMRGTNIDAIKLTGAFLPPPIGGSIPYNGGIIDGNYILGGKTGIWVAGGNQVEVDVFNNIVDGSKVGIELGWGIPKVHVSHNTIIETTEIGIDLRMRNLGSPEPHEITNNIVAVSQGLALYRTDITPEDADLFMDHNLYGGTFYRGTTQETLAERRPLWDASSNLATNLPVAGARTTIEDYLPIVGASLYQSDYSVADVPSDILGQPRPAMPTRGALEVIE